VGKERPPDLLPHLPLDRLHAADVHVLHPAADEADEVMVVLPVRAEEVVELTVGMEHLGDDPAGGQLLQVAVDGGEADAPELPPEPLPDILRAAEGPLPGEEVEDGEPLRRGLEPQPLECCQMLVVHRAPPCK
jgi:hypothetical protein